MDRVRNLSGNFFENEAVPNGDSEPKKKVDPSQRVLRLGYGLRNDFSEYVAFAKIEFLKKRQKKNHHREYQCWLEWIIIVFLLFDLQAYTQLECPLAVPTVWAMWTNHEKLSDGHVSSTFFNFDSDKHKRNTFLLNGNDFWSTGKYKIRQVNGSRGTSPH